MTSLTISARTTATAGAAILACTSVFANIDAQVALEQAKARNALNAPKFAPVFQGTADWQTGKVHPAFAALHSFSGGYESSSNSVYVGLSNSMHKVLNQSFETQLADAYLTFAASQKRMDQDFADILAANIWDLYAR